MRVDQYLIETGELAKSDFIPHEDPTDKQKLEALLESFGATDLQFSKDPSGCYVVKHCYTVFYFDEDGKYLESEGTLR